MSGKAIPSGPWQIWKIAMAQAKFLILRGQCLALIGAMIKRSYSWECPMHHRGSVRNYRLLGDPECSQAESVSPLLVAEQFIRHTATQYLGAKVNSNLLLFSHSHLITLSSPQTHLQNQ